MIHIISLLVSIALAIHIKRKGLTTVELRELLIKGFAQLGKAAVKFKVYRWASGHVWIKLTRQGWVHALWGLNERDGYLVKFDTPEGMTHKRYSSIEILEDYSRK